MADLLAVRRASKKRKPTFQPQDSNKKPKFLARWRKPRGLQNKVRLGKRGHEVCPSPGYGAPRAVRGLSREGLVPVYVSTVAELAGIDAKTCGIVIASTVGTRKRIALYETAQKAGLTVLSVKDLGAALTALKEKVASSQKARKDAAKKKEEKKKAEEKKKKKKEEKKEEKTAEEKKEDEKKQQQKVLTEGAK